MRKFKFVSLLFALTASVAIAADTTYTVQWQGTLRAVHGGDVSGKVPLQQFSGKKNLYAVGPVAELDGEVTAIDGKLHIARVRHGEIKTDSDLSTSASFLVWSEVSAWQPPISLGEKAESHAQLEKLVERLATKSGIDVTKPFPFMLEGVLASVNYHVLSPMKSHETSSGHSAGAKNISVRNVDARIIGFYSKSHEGVFTHKGNAAHLHILEKDGGSGHVDELSVNPETRVLFPR